MRIIFSLLSTFCSIYSMLIFIRIIFSWFGGGYGKIEMFLGRLTDPYIDWFRRFPFLRIGYIDISPVAALAVLSLFNRAFFMLANSAILTFGRMISLALDIAWSAVSFLIVLLIVILVIRLIGYLTNQNTYSRFWQIIDSIVQPVIYRISRIFFGKRILHFFTGILFSIGVLILLAVLGRFAIKFLSIVFSKMPF